MNLTDQEKALAVIAVFEGARDAERKRVAIFERSFGEGVTLSYAKKRLKAAEDVVKALTRYAAMFNN